MWLERLAQRGGCNQSRNVIESTHRPLPTSYRMGDHPSFLVAKTLPHLHVLPINCTNLTNRNPYIAIVAGLKTNKKIKLK